MRSFSVLILALFFGAATASAGPLHDAVARGDATTAERLLNEGADSAELDGAGEPPLLIAALAGHEPVVRLLLDRGAPLGSRNKGGLTALHAAAYGGHLDVVRLLVERGAAVNDTENFYKTSPLHMAAEEGRTDVVSFLLEQEADVSAKERNGYTPLTQAGWREHWDVADLLMKKGATCQPVEIVGDWLFGECTKRQ